ncbi:N-acetylmuramoyl-L-alanine amidase [Paenibacillus sepulcri]|uniref:N-acetylmuramoyl-L-alanine amidase n=1 Tax=Paenibacillus sepulcri TaxID=359917 RepID=A0ABS7C9N0_9BACL|nr:N-acetylmuramoyl-L-alanine amidase [Paenibacillus sepulcri]
MKKIGYLAILICVLFSISSIIPASAKADESYTAKVVINLLNVRSEASLKGNIVGALKNGQLVSVSKEDDYGWLQINSGKVSGWVAGYYLKKVDGTVQTSEASKTQLKTEPKKTAKQTEATVTADSLRIRSGAGTKYEVVGGLAKGQQVAIMGSQSGWVKIQTSNGQAGWVSDRYISGGSGNSVVSTSHSSKSSNGLHGKTIVVDPGHGGDDPGMIGTTQKTMEKDLTLSTSFYLEQELRARGASVVMTRTKDKEKPSLGERVQISGSAHADAFISIHYNSSETKASGTLSFYYSESKDRPLARAIESRLADGMELDSNGISFGDYHVLRENGTPSALIELGFLSNKKDESLVRKSGYQQEAAAAIAKGIEDYFD